MRRFRSGVRSPVRRTELQLKLFCQEESMATSSTVMVSLPLRRPNVIAICAKEAKYEFLKNLRYPMYSVSTVVFPLMFYVLFGLVMGKQMIGSIRSTVYLIPAYGTFGVMGASLFGTAAGLATER